MSVQSRPSHPHLQNAEISSTTCCPFAGPGRSSASSKLLCLPLTRSCQSRRRDAGRSSLHSQQRLPTMEGRTVRDSGSLVSRSRLADLRPLSTGTRMMLRAMMTRGGHAPAGGEMLDDPLVKADVEDKTRKRSGGSWSV